jgi:hypothetical protein
VKVKTPKKTFKSYFRNLKFFFLAIFILSVIQCVLILAGLASFKIFNFSSLTTLIGVVEILVVVYAGFIMIFKKNFSFKNNFFAAILLFISSCFVIFFTPSIFPTTIPLKFKIISYCLIILTNLFLFVLASIIGGIAGRLFFKFKKRRRKK